jgi:hypothetical protein
MNPWPEKNSVLLLDNCAIHHYHDLEELLNERGTYIHCEIVSFYDVDIFRMCSLVLTAILPGL